MSTGVAVHQQGNTIAAISAGAGARTMDNFVDGSGSAGIRFSTLGGSLVSGNTVASACTRLTDCGAIYSWAGRDLAKSVQSATIDGNRLYTNNSSSETVVGVYLDDFTRGVSVRNNLIAGFPMGVFLHNASQMTVENNRIWFPSTVGLLVNMDQLDADWSVGNVLRNNQIVPQVQANVLPGELPTFAAAQAVWLIHALSGEAALSVGRNYFANNSVVQLQGPVQAYASVVGPTGQRAVDDVQWLVMNPGEIKPLRPLRYDTLNLNLGPELVSDGQFNNGLAMWRTHQSTAGSLYATQQLSSFLGCDGPCVSMRASDAGDLLASKPFNMVAGQPHVYRWKTVMPGAATATVGQPYISRETTPWDVMADARGFVALGPRRAAAGEVLNFESFFVPKAASLSRVNLQLETAGIAVAFDAVSVRAILSASSFALTEWATIAFATQDASRTINCSDLGWPSGCNVVGIDGQTIALPHVLAAGTDKLLLRADSPARR
jgi:Periplasmic copper-binding protein (NosD)